jgi:competence protein ComEA
VPYVSVSRSTAFVLVSALIAILVLAGGRLARTGTASEPEIVAPLEPVSSLSATSTARAALVVHVVGAVRRPGLYRLREGARVADAVARAGGSTRRAELAALNLAAPLVDGVQVLVPEHAAVARGGTPADESEAGASDAAIAGLGSKVSLATATAEELDELPGVGPVTAQKILDYRAEHGLFRSVDELDAVPGIGPTRVEQLRDHVTP